ncbi:MAG: 1-acyl-sn-glycerol-3-phosphate acyltransferase [Treponema sp.]|jgi:1-acyl-sn-glycerol-3-phosphate acyltransferase|nr:1-acyl-sn-glycerol-3-phosphate acyltransferase [Treponema sp.]
MFFYLFNIVSAFAGGIINAILFYFRHFDSSSVVLKLILTFCSGFVSAFLIAFILIWIFFIIAAGAVNPNKEYNTVSKFYHWVFVSWYEYINCISRVKIKTSGMDKIPFGTRFLIVSNHRSAFDVFVQAVVLKKEPVGVISKPENFNLPLAKGFMTRNLYLSLDRDDVKKALGTILKAISLLKNNVTSISVFPEGTRSKNGILGEFKPGCLKVAESSLCPVVVAVMDGTQNVSKNFPFRKTIVNFDVIKVYSSEDIKKTNTIDLSAEIRQLMLDKLGK